MCVTVTGHADAIAATAAAAAPATPPLPVLPPPRRDRPPGRRRPCLLQFNLRALVKTVLVEDQNASAVFLLYLHAVFSATFEKLGMPVLSGDTRTTCGTGHHS